jgi:hypothetical protein
VVQLILICGISLFVVTHSHTARSVAAALLAADLFFLAASLSPLCGALKRYNNLSNELNFYTSIAELHSLVVTYYSQRWLRLCRLM